LPIERRFERLSIHPTAVISSEATIAASASIGPFCVIEGNVQIGPHTVVDSHARIGHRFGEVVIGERNHIQHGAVLGGPPQDLGYTDANTRLVIGDENRIGEYVSISLGTEKAARATTIGNSTLLMAFVHVGHDCTIGDHVVITNGTQLAGHVTVEEHALLSGLAGVTQFTRLGRYSFLTAGAFANKDIAPFTIAEGHWARPKAINRIAIRRAGFSLEERRDIERAVRLFLDSSLTIEQVLAEISAQCVATASVERLAEFLRSSSRGLARR
jgi:UDP-N-acetylglucosamine acyltransferase